MAAAAGVTATTVFRAERGGGVSTGALAAIEAAIEAAGCAGNMAERGARLRTNRRAAKLTQAELAAAIGVNYMTIYNAERGRATHKTVAAAEKYIKALAGA